jgi:arabinan endo-1,5-alpha-L-arabinosidase
MNFTATGSHQNKPKGGFITLGELQIPSNGFTISQWFEMSNTQRSARLFDFSNGRNINSILGQFLDNINSIDTYTTVTGNHVTTTSNIITDDIFHHYVFTVFSNGRYNIYIDNVLIFDKVINYPNLSNRVQNYIGKSSFLGDAYFNGQFDDFRYYERTITSQEVNILYNNLLKKDEPINSDF